jgi:hypothetical protein
MANRRNLWMLAAMAFLATLALPLAPADADLVKPEVPAEVPEPRLIFPPATTFTTVVGNPTSIGPGSWGAASVSCPASHPQISGGGGSTSAFDIFFTDSRPSGQGWFVGGKNTGGSTQTLTAWAVCAS